MTPERWRQVKALYDAALAQEPEHRLAFLARASEADQELRREVETLLAQNASKVGILDRPAWEGVPAALSPSAQLGPYRIEAPLGAGGMGQVYRGVDTRLGRPVAIKTVGEEFYYRFEREARAISCLNHPNICTLYDVGPGYLVMELVEGETLAARLQNGRLPMDVLQRYGAEIAAALAAAHAKGIIHRDLKPGNIMVTKSGIKVLDFGLAKIVEANETLTASNVIQGTPAYMAPEQLEGKPCDARTDIFALGLVLYEMANGQRLKQGETANLNPLPIQLAHVIGRCLKTDADDRWQSARDVKAELEWAGKIPPPQERQVRSSRPWVWAAAGVAVVGLLLTGLLQRRPLAPSQRPARLSFSVPGVTGLGFPLPSPDGNNFLFSARNAAGRRSLWIRSLGSVAARQLSGTEEALMPFWRSDGRWIGFYARGKLWKISPDGGSPQTLLSLQDRPNGAAWNASGDIIFPIDNRSGLHRVRESGGSVEPLTQLDLSRTENSHRHMRFLPDGRRFLFTARCGRRENNALYVGSLDSRETHRVMTVQSNVSYISLGGGQQGAFLYVTDGILLKQQFDGRNVVGEPAAIVENVQYNPAGSSASFAVSSDGRVLVFAPALPGPAQLVWFDRSGHAQGTLGPAGPVEGQPRISPDGTRVLYQRPDEHTGNRDVWYSELERGIVRKLTTDPGNDWHGVWSPDGRRILFSSDRAGGPKFGTYIKDSMDPGAGETPLFKSSDFDGSPSDWANKGDWIAFNSWGGTNQDTRILSLPSNGVPFAFLVTSFAEHSPRFSPDAKWIAYVSDESGRSEVYVRRFSGGPAVPEDKIQVSAGGGDFPVWRDSELFYIGGDLKIHSIKTVNLLQTGVTPRPVPLFTPCPDTSVAAGLFVKASWQHPYDVTADGQRFLIHCSTGSPERYEVLLDWKF